MDSFTTTVFGKSIIAGEHTVIRGGPALVVPVVEKQLQLTFKPKDKEFEATFHGDMKEELRLVFWGLMERALDMAGRKRSELVGELLLKNTVPVGAGLGASATLCVAVGRFFHSLKWVKHTELPEFCRLLENIFHGESSGADIAAALAGEPIEFQRGQTPKSLKINWQPDWYLSYSGQRGLTSECVRRVKELWNEDKKEGQKIDDEMKESVQLAKIALTKSKKEGLLDLVEAIQKARHCFDRWGLSQGANERHMQKLAEFGAIASKPTGSGGGGYILSLWRQEPPKEIHKDLIPLVI